MCLYLVKFHDSTTCELNCITINNIIIRKSHFHRVVNKSFKFNFVHRISFQLRRYGDLWHLSLCVKLLFTLWNFYNNILGMGTLVLDARLGLYNDPPSAEGVRLIQGVNEAFECIQILLFGFVEKNLLPYLDTPSFKKFCKAMDSTDEVLRMFIDKKMKEIEEMAKQDDLQENQSELGFLDHTLALLLTVITHNLNQDYPEIVRNMSLHKYHMLAYKYKIGHC